MVIPPQSTRGVSTGLHLTFEDDQLNSTSSASTSGRGNISSPLLSIVSEDLSTQIQQESEEIELLFKAQVVLAFFYLPFFFFEFSWLRELDVHPLPPPWDVKRGV